MAAEMYRVLWFFAVYAVLGWCVEVVYCTVRSGKVCNRGFLNGPVCPVYGFGMLAICKVTQILPVDRWGEISFLPLFLMGMVLASCVELAAGWLLFHLFHARWWDYSERPLNIGGYICLQMSLLWGIGTIIMVDCIHPITERLTADSIPPKYGWPVLAVYYAVMLADLVVTVSIVVGLNKRLGELEEIRSSMRAVSDAMSERLGENALRTQQHLDEDKVQAALARAEIRDLAREKMDVTEKRLHRQLTGGAIFGPRRLMTAFPDAIHRDHKTLWEQLSKEVNDKYNNIADGDHFQEDGRRP